MRNVWRVRVWGMVAAGVSASVCGCSDGKGGSVPAERDAQVDMLDKDRQLNERQIGLEQSWREVQAGTREAASVRESLKSLIWKGSAPEQLRVRAMELLLSDTTAEGLADTRNLMRLRLPTESSWKVIGVMCSACEKNGGAGEWRELTAALVRSYARKVPVPTDDARPERGALLALYPGERLDQIAFRVFTKPVEHGAVTKIDDWATKSRDAAWELLSRIDPDGSMRGALLAGDTSNEPVVQDLARCARELRVVPVTGSELAWLRSLLNAKDSKNATWWQEAQRAVAGLSSDQVQGMQLRHVEAVRWAAAKRPEWVRASRAELMSELGQRVEGRRVWRKTEGLGQDEQISREALSERGSELVWGDVLALLIIDTAIQEQSIVDALFVQALADETDTSTELGGVLLARDGGGFDVKSCPPRPTQRVNDRTFVAPDEMLNGMPRVLAHYHFHVQGPSNADYAGPGRGDLDYAAMHGRSCLVFTSVKDGVLNADYYQRNGATIDLGEVVRRTPK